MNYFRGTTISIGVNTPGPDLSLPDYFLSGYVKNHCYATRPATLGELKTEIICIFVDNDVAMLQLVIRNLLMRFKKVIEVDVRQIKNFLNFVINLTHYYRL